VSGKPQEFRSKRLGQRLASLRNEKVVVPDWKRIGLRSIPIGLLFGTWAGDAFDLWALPSPLSSGALALSTFLGGISYLQLIDRRLWIERSPPAADSAQSAGPRLEP
jgi:hypothetical protein